MMLQLENLEARHRISSALAACLAEAAFVCLQRHHSSPLNLGVELDREQTTNAVAWAAPSELMMASWKNRDDATRDGAYCVALTAVEVRTGMVAVDRAETRTGADFYIALHGEDHGDFENCFRLEVSGLDTGNETKIRQRLREKVAQAQRGQSALPALAVVVGFKEALVLVARVVES